jgi:hypothetical protein
MLRLPAFDNRGHDVRRETRERNQLGEPRPAAPLAWAMLAIDWPGFASTKALACWASATRATSLSFRRAGFGRELSGPGTIKRN